MKSNFFILSNTGNKFHFLPDSFFFYINSQGQRKKKIVPRKLVDARAQCIHSFSSTLNVEILRVWDLQNFPSFILLCRAFNGISNSKFFKYR